MLRHLFALFSLFLVLPVGASSIPEPQKINDHCWAWIGPYGPPTRDNGGFRMNLGLVVGSAAVAVIDSGYGSGMAQEMLTQIRRITALPVRYVLNTNSQPHRIMGNGAFKSAGAEVIAAAEAVPRITGEGVAFAATVARILELPEGSVLAPGVPDRAIQQETRLDLGGITLRVIPVGTAHTQGSLVVVVEPGGVVFAGDVLYGGRLPAILPESKIGDWIIAFDRIREFDGDQFVPGHGNPGPLSAFAHPTRDYLEAMKRHMDEAVDKGVDLQEAIRTFDASPWASLADFTELSGRNAHQAYLQSEADAFK